MLCTHNWKIYFVNRGSVIGQPVICSPLGNSLIFCIYSKMTTVMFVLSCHNYHNWQQDPNIFLINKTIMYTAA